MATLLKQQYRFYTLSTEFMHRLHAHNYIQLNLLITQVKPAYKPAR